MIFMDYSANSVKRIAQEAKDDIADKEREKFKEVFEKDIFPNILKAALSGKFKVTVPIPKEFSPEVVDDFLYSLGYGIPYSYSNYDGRNFYTLTWED
jgi:hypothetical protein